MIIWSGLGFLPLVFMVILGLFFNTDSNGPISDKAFAYTLFLTGLTSGALGWWLRTRQPAQIVIDKESGEEIALRRSHSLFFIPIFYWGPIFIAIGLWVYMK